MTQVLQELVGDALEAAIVTRRDPSSVVHEIHAVPSSDNPFAYEYAVSDYWTRGEAAH